MLFDGYLNLGKVVLRFLFPGVVQVAFNRRFVPESEAHFGDDLSKNRVIDVGQTVIRSLVQGAEILAGRDLAVADLTWRNDRFLHAEPEIGHELLRRCRGRVVEVDAGEFEVGRLRTLELAGHVLVEPREDTCKVDLLVGAEAADVHEIA